MKYVAFCAVMLATPFVALFFALVCFYSGWVGGWSLALESIRE